MQNYKMILQYEGTRYDGWQKQGNTDNTIQGILEGLLNQISGENVEVNGSGRTDAGVHAMAQCASFSLENALDCSKLKAELNAALNRDIRILSIENAPPRFHARLNAKGKSYTYRICTGEKADVFNRHIMYLHPCRADVDSIKKAAGFLVGSHDFKSFCSNKRMKKSTVREIYSINVKCENYVLELTFTGNGFLYNMVRILAGTLLDVGTGKISPDSIPAILESLDRKNAGATLPSGGLMLDEVYY